MKLYRSLNMILLIIFNNNFADMQLVFLQQ